MGEQKFIQNYKASNNILCSRNEWSSWKVCYRIYGLNFKFAYPNTGPFTDTYEKIEFYVPALSNETPHDFLSFGVWGYFSSGGTMRFPYWKSYTFDLKSCLQVDYTTAFNLNYEALEEKILEYALISDLTDQSLIVSSYRFDEDYFKNSIFNSQLYIYHF